MEKISILLENQLPSFYKNILPQELLLKPLKEIDKCANCIMACGDKPTYSNDVKCCTYYPFIPNFMVGNILKNNGAMSSVILSYISDKRYTLPIGLCSPESYHYKNLAKNNIGFGKDSGLLCPFYDKGKCSIWDQRNSECISFQCYSSYGEKGLRFWKLLGDLMFDVELHLAKKLMTEHNFPSGAVKSSIELINYQKFSQMRPEKEVLTVEEWGSHWLGFTDKVANYYVSCYDMVDGMDLKSFVAKLPDYQKLVDIRL